MFRSVLEFKLSRVCTCMHVFIINYIRISFCLYIDTVIAQVQIIRFSGNTGLFTENMNWNKMLYSFFPFDNIFVSCLKVKMQINFKSKLHRVFGSQKIWLENAQYLDRVVSSASRLCRKTQDLIYDNLPINWLILLVFLLSFKK